MGKTELSEKLCADEAVCFIADRHNVTPQRLLHYFFFGKASGKALKPEMKAILLEPNEIEILKGLSEAVKD